MTYKIDFNLATSQQIEAALCQQLERLRLSKNFTQAMLAKDSGVSQRTIGRTEKGEGTSLDTFIRIIKALGLSHHLQTLLPDTSLLPMVRVQNAAKPKRRARPKNNEPPPKHFVWGDEK